MKTVTEATEARVRAELEATFAEERVGLDVARLLALDGVSYYGAPSGTGLPRQVRPDAEAKRAKVEADFAARLAELEASQEARVRARLGWLAVR